MTTEQTHTQPEKRPSEVRSDALLDASFRVHAKEIVEYVLRGNGRRIVPKAIYLAAWEIQYALNRTSNKQLSTKEKE